MPEENKTIPSEWFDEFEAAAKRSLKNRLRYAFIKTYRPVMDDAEFRAFDTMAEYRRWCEENLPRWLGYSRVKNQEIENHDQESSQLRADADGGERRRCTSPSPIPGATASSANFASEGYAAGGAAHYLKSWRQSARLFACQHRRGAGRQGLAF
jgi:hypothetical protein